MHTKNMLANLVNIMACSSCARKQRMKTLQLAQPLKTPEPLKLSTTSNSNLISSYYTIDFIEEKIQELTTLMQSSKYKTNYSWKIFKLKKVLRGYETAIKTKELDGILQS